MICRSGLRSHSHGVYAASIFSPFVPASNDSESGHADPSGTSLAIPDRLARDQPDRSLQTRGRALRALSAPARTPCRAACRGGRRLVGWGDRRMAGRSRPSTPSAADVRASRGRSNDPQACLSRNGASQPRSHLQRTALAQSRGALPALPHDPRRPRTSTTPVVERVSATRLGRSLHRPVQLASTVGCRAADGASSMIARLPAERGRSGCREYCRVEAAAWEGVVVVGARHDPGLSNPRNGRDVATSARR